MNEFTPSPRFSKRTHIVTVGLVYAAPLGLFIGYKLYARGDMEPVAAVVLLFATIVAGVVMGFASWHLWFKRHQL
jgi:hypothetical protein